jgi:hypothetical protein
MPETDERDTRQPPATLTQALRALDADDRDTLHASAAVEARLLAEVRTLAWSQCRRQIHIWLATAAAIAIAATGIWIASWRSDRATDSVTEVATGFMPLMYSAVPMTDGQLVRLEVPRRALVTFGLTTPESIDVDAAAETVLVDVVVGEDGLARAVRFVHPRVAIRSSRQ